MNKVSRLLGSAALATCLAVGGTAGAASANDYKDNDSKSNSRHDNDKRRDDNNRRDGRNSYHNDYKFLLRCHDWRGNYWFEKSNNRYDIKKNCYVVRVWY